MGRVGAGALVLRQLHQMQQLMRYESPRGACMVAVGGALRDICVTAAVVQSQGQEGLSPGSSQNSAWVLAL
eukprot:996297-Pyramimonas_sp.AAC.1